MMKHLPITLLFLLLMPLLTGCIIGVPAIAIPEKEKEFHIQPALSNNGVHLTAMYNPTLRNGIVLRTSVMTGYYGELTYLRFSANKKAAVGIGIGYSKYNIPAIIYGGTYGISDQWGEYLNIPIQLNLQWGKSGGLYQSLVFAAGNNNGTCPLICTRFTGQVFRHLYWQPDFYFRPGAKGRFFILVGGRLRLAELYKAFDSEADYIGHAFRLGIGFDLKANGKKLKPTSSERGVW